MKTKGGKKRRKIQVGCANKSKKNKYFKGGRGMAEFSPMTLPKVPNALIGPPWLPSMPNLGNSNHYAHNLYKNDSVTTMKNPGSQQNFDYRRGKMWGGKKRSTKKLKRGGRRLKGGLKGGGGFIDKFIPSDVLNAGRYVQYNAQNTWNGYFGYPPAVNPLPWVQPNIQ